MIPPSDWFKGTLYQSVFTSITRFIDSESDLDVCTKSLLPLAQVGTISYPELIKAGAASRITGLLGHENLDIVTDAIEVIKEFTDEDVDENVGDEAEDRDEALKTLVDALVHFILNYITTSTNSHLGSEFVVRTARPQSVTL